LRNILSLHPETRAAALVQQGHLTAALTLLRCRKRLSDMGQRLLERTEDALGILSGPAQAPPARMQPTLPFNGRVLFALHSCGAFDPSGYASRSVALISALVARGVMPIITIRPGYPWDLANHRNTPKCAEVHHGGLRFQLVPDADATIHRPESIYIDTYARHLIQLALAHDVSIIHAASNYLNGTAAAQAGRTLGITSIYEVRGLWHLTRAFGKPGYAKTEHYRYCEMREIAACQQVDHVITLSDGLRQWLIERSIAANKISVVGNAAHLLPSVPCASVLSGTAVRERLGIPASAKVIGYLGTLVEYEGLDILLYAHARTPEAHRPYLLFVGSGKHEVVLRKLAKTLGTRSKVIFAGRVSADQVSAHYAAMDALILPRRDDILTRLVPAIKPFEILAHGRILFVSPPLAQALGDTLPDGYAVIDLESLDRLDSLLTADVAAQIDIAVPTWDDRAEEVLALYRRANNNPA
jgi:glycosyltransferase involved in cell wall biosynthesis